MPYEHCWCACKVPSDFTEQLRGRNNFPDPDGDPEGNRQILNDFVEIYEKTKRNYQMVRTDVAF
jgi:hypothetical protein